MTQRALIAIFCALFAGVAASGQEPTGTKPQPTFRAETRAIDVDAVVTDLDGAFVRGLTREDFELLEDGKPQEIAAFTLVDVPIEASPDPARGLGLTIDSDVTTNAIAGRIYVMLLDSPGLRLPERAHVSLEQMALVTRRIATRFVDEALGPNDLMAVIHVQDWRSDAQSLTSNKQLLRASIDRLKPDSDIPPGTSPPLPYCNAQRLRTSYEVIQTIAERLGSVTGRRKAILWVNGRVPLDPNDPEECGLTSEDVVNPSRSGGQPTVQGLTGAQVGALAFFQRDAMRAATRNNVSIYPIDPVGLTADPPEFQADNTNPRYRSRPMKRLAALRGIAEDTGGEAVINTNNFSPAFERIVRANSSYYLLAYRPVVDHRDGKLHTITVRVRRPNLSVRARKGYIAPGSDPPIEAKLLPGVSASGAAALVKAVPDNGLDLRMFLTPFKGVGGNGSVVLGAELRGLSAEAGAQRRVEISYLSIDPQGATRVAPPKMLNVKFAPGAEPLTAGTAVEYIDRLALPPGRHEVRVAISQPGGATGSIVAHVEVPAFTREPLTMSGIVLSSGATARASVQGDTVLSEALGAEPTTARSFTRRTTLTAYAEAYTAASTPASEVTMTATLTTGKSAKVRGETVTQVTDDPGRTGFAVQVPLADLMPGGYVLTLEAKTGKRTDTRQIGFVVTE
jgi:VWFA-related protein